MSTVDIPANYNIALPTWVKIGDPGAIISELSDLGSLQRVEWTHNFKREYATSTRHYGAKMKSVDFAPEDGLALTGEEFMLADVARMFGGTVSGSGFYSDGSGGTTTFYAVAANGFRNDGVQGTVYFPRVAMKPNIKRSQDGKQELWTMEFEAFLDTTITAATTGQLFGWTPDSELSGAPSLTITPDNAATGVARNVAPTIVCARELDAATLRKLTSFFRTDTGAAVAGAAWTTSDGKTFTFTPTSQLAATTQYAIVCNAGIPDLAGNLTAQKIVTFTTTS